MEHVEKASHLIPQSPHTGDLPQRDGHSQRALQGWGHTASNPAGRTMATTYPLGCTPSSRSPSDLGGPQSSPVSVAGQRTRQRPSHGEGPAPVHTASSGLSRAKPRLPSVTCVTTSFLTWWPHRTPELAAEGQSLAICPQRMSGVPQEGAAESQKQAAPLLARERVRVPTAVTAAPRASRRGPRPGPGSGLVTASTAPGEGQLSESQTFHTTRVILTHNPRSEGEQAWGRDGSQSSPAFLLSTIQ